MLISRQSACIATQIGSDVLFCYARSSMIDELIGIQFGITCSRSNRMHVACALFAVHVHENIVAVAVIGAWIGTIEPFTNGFHQKMNSLRYCVVNANKRTYNC